MPMLAALAAFGCYLGFRVVWLAERYLLPQHTPDRRHFFGVVLAFIVLVWYYLGLLFAAAVLVGWHP